ncbi:MAG: (2Fe-2S)-binding protein [Xanthomonadales bacterium]|jgi:isoquinoline 1-oxidoreductase alpha subunit|nr:(2Fe-2S)-binding protein [Gammaproteobacteria bacterium]NNK38163.1 (2Fe-2S)-binding protein [Xanthomonadales bacterium]
MGKVTLKVNGERRELELAGETPLLWALRDQLDLVGTKYGCGIGLCGSCMVLVDGEPVQSCLMPAGEMEGREITTIEGLDPDGAHPVQRAWNDVDVAQCGYCQGGQILSAVALLRKNPQPGDADIDRAMSGNICRCGTYPRIRRAIKLAARYASDEGGAS